MYTRKLLFALMVSVWTSSHTSQLHDAVLHKLRRELKSQSDEFLKQYDRVKNRGDLPSTQNTPAVKDRSNEASEATHIKGGVRRERSQCPSGIGNLGFNSYNFLTFALQAFNGVINTINNINNNNNNNNNNNINSGNNVNSNFNQETSNVNAMSMLIVVVPPVGRRRKRELWENTENGHCSQDNNDREIHRVIQETYSAISNINQMSKKDIYCGKYILCLNIQDNYARYGLHILSELSHQEKLWGNIVKPMLDHGKCSSLFPECIYTND
ncbi:uncharacterized protein [Panulirus ornatus]|uniref:uncharacterized protein n=1 Tax=Panulirus ornatus TaxID=150431 RepID=UPI003A8C2DC4